MIPVQPPADVRVISRHLARVREELGRVVVGYQDAVDELLVALLARGHILLEGVPGLAKTSLAKAFADTSGLDFHRIQFTQDLLPADVTGHYFFNQKTMEFEIRKGAIFGNLVLADEINRAPPKTQSALLEAMEERQATIEGRTHPLPDPFLLIATMNPVDQDGVYRLPEAQLDRFMVRTRLTYLDPEDEFRMAVRLAGPPVRAGRLLDVGHVLAAQRAAAGIEVGERVLRYIHAITLATRRDERVALGASPRFIGQATAAARALALIRGRSHVIPDDVKHLAPSILAHRLIVDVDAELAGSTADIIVHHILRHVVVPKGEDVAVEIREAIRE